MRVKTRYRDIPEAEARRCQPRSLTSEKTLDWETQMRNKPIEIETPAVLGHSEYVICGGPFYRRNLGGGFCVIVCQHIAEIGD